MPSSLNFNLTFYFSGITFNRGCCTIKVGSPVCPPGASDQWEYTETWESHKIRCKEDLCNTGKGDGSDNTG